MMARTVSVHINIISRFIGIIHAEQFHVQALLQIQLPTHAAAKHVKIVIARIVVMSSRNWHKVAAAAGIRMLKNEVAIIKADITRACTACGLLLISQITLEASKADVIDGYIRLIESMISAIQVNPGIRSNFQAYTVVNTSIPFAHQIRNIESVLSICTFNINIVQCFVVQSRRIIVGNTCIRPRAKDFF